MSRNEVPSQQFRHRSHSSALKSTPPIYHHQKWQQPHHFALLLCVGSNMISGFADFPYRCFQYGGFIFHIIYIMVYIIFGMPMLILESHFGQYFGQTNLNIIRQICPITGGLGIIQLITMFVFLIKNHLKLAIFVNYLFTAIVFSAPWVKCGHLWSSTNCFTKSQNDKCVEMAKYFWNNTCYEAKHYCQAFNMSHEHENLTYCISGGEPKLIPQMIIENRTTPGQDYFNYMTSSKYSGGISDWYLISCAILSWLVTLVCLHKGLTKTGIMVCHLLVFTSSIIFIFLFIATLMYSGGFSGIYEAFYVDSGNLLDINVWLNAVMEVIHSLNLGLGTNSALASSNQLNSDLITSVLAAGFYTVAVEQLFYSFFLYALWGISSLKSGREIEAIANEYLGNLAVLAMMPDLVQYHPAPQFWVLLFLTVLICKTITNNLIILDTLVLSLNDVFRFCQNKPRSTRFIISVAGWLIGSTVPLMDSGVDFMEAFFKAFTFEFEVLAIIELIIFGLVYGFASNYKYRQFRDLREMFVISDNMYLYLRTAYYFITPTVAVLYLVLKAYTIPLNISNNVTKAIIIVDVAKSVIIFLLYAIYVLWNIRFKRHFLYTTYTPTYHWSPQSYVQQSKYKPPFVHGSCKYSIAVLANKMGAEL